MNIKKGRGEYLVLVHGALTDGSMWLPHMEYLKADYDVIAVTLRHFGEPEAGGFGINTHADDLAELLTDLAKAKAVNVVGWSYGADVVLNMLVKYEIAVAKVFLYEPGFPGCLQEQDMYTWSLDANAMFSKVFEHFSAGNNELAVEALIDGSGNKPGYFLAQERAVRELQLSKAYTLTQQLNQQEQPAIESSAISKISTPVVIAYGSMTRDIFKLVSRRTAELLRFSEVMEISGEGHMLPQDNPFAFSTQVKLILRPEG